MATKPFNELFPPSAPAKRKSPVEARATTPSSERMRSAIRNEIVAAARLLYAIVATGDELRRAEDFGGNPALGLDRLSELIIAIDRCGGAPTFSDIGRALRVTRQTARELALKAEHAALVELFASRDDRRVIQAMLTPKGRLEASRLRAPPVHWTLTLLNGLEPDAMRTTTHVVQVIGQRLRAYEKERRPKR